MGDLTQQATLGKTWEEGGKEGGGKEGGSENGREDGREVGREEDGKEALQFNPFTLRLSCVGYIRVL